MKNIILMKFQKSINQLIILKLKVVVIGKNIIIILILILNFYRFQDNNLQY